MNEAPPDGHKLNDTQWFTLRALADVIIPASTAYGVPGAGDELICKAILRDVGERLPKLAETLEAVHVQALANGGENFFSLSEDARHSVALAYQQAEPRQADRLANWVMQCYYRDDRVLESLGIEARPPFPDGYNVGQSDWSKLEPVRRRAPFLSSAVLIGPLINASGTHAKGEVRRHHAPIDDPATPRRRYLRTSRHQQWLCGA